MLVEVRSVGSLGIGFSGLGFGVFSNMFFVLHDVAFSRVVVMKRQRPVGGCSAFRLLRQYPL